VQYKLNIEFHDYGIIQFQFNTHWAFLTAISWHVADGGMMEY